MNWDKVVTVDNASLIPSRRAKISPPIRQLVEFYIKQNWCGSGFLQKSSFLSTSITYYTLNTTSDLKSDCGRPKSINTNQYCTNRMTENRMAWGNLASGASRATRYPIATQIGTQIANNIQRNSGGNTRSGSSAKMALNCSGSRLTDYVKTLMQLPMWGWMAWKWMKSPSKSP